MDYGRYSNSMSGFFFWNGPSISVGWLVGGRRGGREGGDKAVCSCSGLFFPRGIDEFERLKGRGFIGLALTRRSFPIDLKILLPDILSTFLYFNYSKLTFPYFLSFTASLDGT